MPSTSPPDRSTAVPDGPLQHLLAWSPTAIFVGTLSGSVAACNAAACALLRRLPADLVGAPIHSFDLGRGPGRVEGMHALLAVGKVFRTASIYLRGDGTRVRVQAHISPCLWNDRMHAMGVVVPVGEPDEGEDEAALPTALDGVSDHGGMVVRCAWCSSTLRPPGEWVPSSQPHVPEGGLRITHGLCSVCSILHFTP